LLPEKNGSIKKYENWIKNEMELFKYENEALKWAGVPVRQLAEQFGTPLYAYSEDYLLNRVERLRAAGKGAGIYYSVKACSNLSILRSLRDAGCGADIVSGGELYRCLKAGIHPGKIVFSGVGKSAEEIRYAIEQDILFLSVESEPELHEIQRIAGLLKKTARISLRVNPNVDAGTHPYISTGLKENKFGIPFDDVVRLYREAQAMSDVEPVGLGFHIGSQITDLSAFQEAVAIGCGLIRDLRKDGIVIRHLDVGGGLGIQYAAEEAPDPERYAASILSAVDLPDLEIMFDPGRSVVGNAGILIARILYVKDGARRFYISDAGMNDLIRPALYEAYHHVYPDPLRPEGPSADLVGPVCESGDFFARDRALPAFRAGDLCVLASAGAYGFSMTSNYNSRPRPAEVLIRRNGNLEVIRVRETLEDLVRGE
jgi:diaminopimelate decarboxylase